METLEQLTRQRSLSGDEIDEFDRLYRSTTTDLARVRTLNPDPDVIAELSRILSAARGVSRAPEGCPEPLSPVSSRCPYRSRSTGSVG